MLDSYSFFARVFERKFVINILIGVMTVAMISITVLLLETGLFINFQSGTEQTIQTFTPTVAPDQSATTSILTGKDAEDFLNSRGLTIKQFSELMTLSTSSSTPKR